MSSVSNRIKILYAAQADTMGSYMHQYSLTVLASTNGEKTSINVVFENRNYWHRLSPICTIKQVVASPDAAINLAKHWANNPLEAVALEPVNQRMHEQLDLHFPRSKVKTEIIGTASSLPGWSECSEEAKSGWLHISLALGQALEEAVSDDALLSADIPATLNYYLENVPLCVGHWGSFKRLFKLLEVKPDTAAPFGRALARIDSGATRGQRLKVSKEDLSILSPFLPEQIATAETLAYLSRRGRRYLRHQSKQDPAAYCHLAYEFLKAADRLDQTVSISQHWILSDVLFGRGAWHTNHGRGPMELPKTNDMYRRRWDRAPRAWNGHISLVNKLWLCVGTIPEIQIWAFNVLKSQGFEIPRMNIRGLKLALLNPHPPIRKLACNQVAESPSNFHRLDYAAAVAFFEYSTNKEFNSVFDALESQAKKTVVKQAVVDYVSDHGLPGILRGESVAVHSLRDKKLLSFTLRHAREAMSDPEILNFALYIGETDRFRPLELWINTFQSLTLPTLIELRLHLPQLSSPTKAAIDEACRKLTLSGAKNDALATALIHSPSRTLRDLAWDMLTIGEASAEAFDEIWRSLADHAIESSGARRLRECIYERPRIATLLQLQNAADLLSVVSLALADREFRAAKKTLQYLSDTEDEAVIAHTLDQFTSLHPNWPWHQERTLLIRLTAKTPGVLTFIWKGLGQGQFESLIEYIRRVDSIVRAFFDNVNPADLLRINTQQAELLQAVLLASPTRLVRDQSLAIASATCPAADVSTTAIALLEARGGIRNIFMQLFESQLPAAMDAAERFVRELPAGHTLTRALIMICDSGVREVSTVGLALLQDRDGDYDPVSVYSALSEHKRPDVTAEVARYVLEGGQVRGRGIQRFDNRILRTRRYGRKAKELVKQRIGAETELTAVQTSVTRIVGTERIKSLLAMARGASKRDQEWALRELVRLSENGVDVPSLTVSTTS